MAKKKAEKKARKAKQIDWGPAVLVVLLLAVMLFAGSVISEKYRQDKLLAECRALQESPELIYPCVCYPSDKPSDLAETHGDAVERMTDGYCRCDCQIGENQTYTAYILRTTS